MQVFPCLLRGPRWGPRICILAVSLGDSDPRGLGWETRGHRAGQPGAQTQSPRAGSSAACSPPAACQALFSVSKEGQSPGPGGANMPEEGR